MRQPDINRVLKARQHIEAARTVLSSIKWENVTNLEYGFLLKAKDEMQCVDWHLRDVLNIQETQKP